MNIPLLRAHCKQLTRSPIRGRLLYKVRHNMKKKGTKNQVGYCAPDLIFWGIFEYCSILHPYD
jgi:hypothetical protein